MYARRRTVGRLPHVVRLDLSHGHGRRLGVGRFPRRRERHAVGRRKLLRRLVGLQSGLHDGQRELRRCDLAATGVSVYCQSSDI